MHVSRLRKKLQLSEKRLVADSGVWLRLSAGSRVPDGVFCECLKGCKVDARKIGFLEAPYCSK